MSKQQPRLKPTEAFRIVCWKGCVFAEERFEKLSPKYYCPTCLLPEKDLPKGCPDCQLTRLFNSVFKQGAKEEIDLRGGLPDGWTLDRLIQIHGVVSQTFAENNEEINPAWDESFVELVRILKQERAQQKYINDYNQYQRLKAQAAKK